MNRAGLIVLWLAACNTSDGVATRPRQLAPREAALALGAAPISVDARGVPRLLRTGPAFVHDVGAASPAHRARGYLNQLAPAWGVRTLPSLDEVGEIPALGGTIIRLQQSLDGIPVDRGELRVLMRNAGELVAVSGTMLDGGTRRGGAFALDRDAAITRAGQQAAIEPASARATQIWYGGSGGLIAAWDVYAYGTGAVADGWRTVIAADDGRVLEHHSLAQNDGFDYRAFADSTGDLRPRAPIADFDPHPTPIPDGTISTFLAPPLLNVTGLDHPAGVAGPDPWLPPTATETVGNNCDVYTDLYMPRGYSPGDYRASITSAGVFDRTYDPSQGTVASQDQHMAVLTSTFFTINWLHDFWYDAGFVESAGNAQTDNYGRGGIAGDPLHIASKPGNRDNSRMVIMPDGMSPEMQLYSWDGAETRSIDLAPAGSPVTETNVANFGPTSFDITGPLALAPTDACAPLGASMSGEVVIVDEGGCSAKTKALTLQTAGAAGMVLVDHTYPWTAQRLFEDAAVTTPITIGSIAITGAQGAALKADLTATPRTASLHRVHGPDLASGLDYQLVAHEFGHYLHWRLSPSCSNQACLAMSEGWGDFDALLATARPGDDLHGAFPISFYSTQGWADDAGFFGIRRIAYSIDPAIDALTYRHMRNDEPLPVAAPIDPNGNPNSEVHNTGEVWATAMWEVYVALQGAGSGSADTFESVHHKMAQYVVAGLAMIPPDPTPLDARDAMIAAAAANSSSDATVMVAAFARRGFGTCAVAAPPASLTFNETVESSTVNGKLVVGTPTLADTVVACDSDGILDAGETARISVPIANTGYAPLTAVTVTLTPTTPGLGVATPTATIGTVPAFGSANATFDVTLADANAKDGQLSIVVETPDGCIQQTTVPLELLLNSNEVAASSAKDDFDTVSSVWHAEGLTQPASLWERDQRPALDGYWHAPVPLAVADDALVSPPMTADATAPVTIGFTHRYAFAPDDGAVIEYTLDAGASWNDLSVLADPGYNGIIRQYGTALDDRPGFVDSSTGYPSTAQVMIDLGTKLAGQTFQLRFRFAGAGHHFVSDPPAGWDLEEVTTSGAGTPFPSDVADPNACATPPPPMTKPTGGGCCDAGSLAGGNAALSLLVLAFLRRRRGRVAAGAVALALATGCGPPTRHAVPVDSPPAVDAAGAQCSGTQACQGNDLVVCNPDGSFGDMIQQCGQGQACVGSDCVDACTSDGVDLVYVVDTEQDFLSFDPRKLPGDPFTRVGTLACPTTMPSLLDGSTPATPFSMAIDRNGVAWVEYSSGEVFNVSIADASCTATAYVPQASGMKLFGMGFSTESTTTSSEKLYISGGSARADPGGNLADVDTQGGNYTPAIIGPIYALSDVQAELTGTNEGKLFGFFPRFQVAAYVQELDKANAMVVGMPQKIGMGGLGVSVHDWAFAQWGGRFYIFVTVNDSVSDHSSVHVLDRATGVYWVALTELPYHIVGAGVSICAPSVVE